LPIYRICWLGFSFYVDEEVEIRSAGIHRAMELLDALAQWLQVQSFEGALRINFVWIMRHQELAIYEVNIRFDAAEAVVERIEERSRVLVIIMCMRVRQRDLCVQPANEPEKCREQPEQAGLLLLFCFEPAFECQLGDAGFVQFAQAKLYHAVVLFL